MSELKPCPFCGSENVRITWFINGTFRVMCADCMASHSSTLKARDAAICRWNMRALGEFEDNGHLTLKSEREKRLEFLVKQLWYLVNHRSGYGYAAALEAIEELGIEVDEDER